MVRQIEKIINFTEEEKKKKIVYTKRRERDIIL